MLSTMLTRDQLAARIDAFPRVEIAHTPTPLEEMTRLRESLAEEGIGVPHDLHQTRGPDGTGVWRKQSTPLRVRDAAHR